MLATIPGSITRGVTLTPARKAPAAAAALAVERTGDVKLSACPEILPCRKPSGQLQAPCKHSIAVSVTHAAKRSCPVTCPFYVSPEQRAAGVKDPCYAGHGHQGMVTRRLEAGAAILNADALMIAIDEAAAIDTLTGRNLLRLHIVGDSATDRCADIVSAAAQRYSARHGQVVWTYTHGWRETSHQSWRDVSVLASCETDDDVRLATSRGYAVALVRAHADLPRTVGGLRTIPCPQQTGAKLDCASCKMCTRDQSLAGRACIVFDPHGDVNAVNSAIINRQ